MKELWYNLFRNMLQLRSGWRIGIFRQSKGAVWNCSSPLHSGALSFFFFIFFSFFCLIIPFFMVVIVVIIFNCCYYIGASSTLIKLSYQSCTFCLFIHNILLAHTYVLYYKHAPHFPFSTVYLLTVSLWLCIKYSVITFHIKDYLFIYLFIYFPYQERDFLLLTYE